MERKIINIELERTFQDYKVIARTLIADDPENVNFQKDPDDTQEHSPQWHQFGVLTHSRKFLDYYDTEVRAIIRGWGMSEIIEKVLAETIDGVSKDQLLRLVAIYHDLGKFQREPKPRGYSDHEQKSKEIILHNKQVQDYLVNNFKLTPDQLQYIADCAGLHFELGKVRDIAYKNSPLGFTIAFTQDPSGIAEINKYFDEHNSYRLEIGLLFLLDSMAKTDIIIQAVSDEDIVEKLKTVPEILSSRELNPKLINAIRQLPVNIEVARIYFSNLKKE